MALPSPTIFIDLDGTIARYSFETFTGRADLELLPGTLDKLRGWKAKGYHIVITTGRTLSQLETERQLKAAGVPYDQIVMGIGGGRRILINDTKPDGTITAVAYSLPRDQGIADIHE